MLNKSDFKHKNLVSFFTYVLFVLYILIAAELLFFSPYRQAAHDLNSAGSTPYNLIPFETIMIYIKASAYLNKKIWLSNLLGNVLAFLPLGVFLPLLFKRYMNFTRTIFFVLFTTISVEIIQFITKVGSLDVDDVILNTFGGAIGFFIYHFLYLVTKKKLESSLIKFRLLKDGETPPWHLLLLADPCKDLVIQYVRQGKCYIAEIEKEMLGVVVLLKKSESKVEIVNLAVDPSAQGRGIGTLLLQKSIETAEVNGFDELEIATGNSSLYQIGLYQKIGFRLSSIEHDFFLNNGYEPIYENGIRCTDLVRLNLKLKDEVAQS